MEICRDIKSLDHAKKHLTSSITALKRLHMLITGVEQLRAMVAKRQYREVGNLLEAVSQLLQGFADYKQVPKIKSLNETVVVLKEDLNKQIFEEFNRCALLPHPCYIPLILLVDMNHNQMLPLLAISKMFVLLLRLLGMMQSMQQCGFSFL